MSLVSSSSCIRMANAAQRSLDFAAAAAAPKHRFKLRSDWLLSKLHAGMFLKQASRRRRWRAVNASLFGVGAPEVIVIAVVSLLVFGPKGLAEVARSLGKTLRAFQPAIRELQDVSTEFKQALEKEIGLDELKSTSQRQQKNTSKVAKQAYSTEEYSRVTEEQARELVSEEDRRAAEAQAWGGVVPKKDGGGGAPPSSPPSSSSSCPVEEENGGEQKQGGTGPRQDDGDAAKVNGR